MDADGDVLEDAAMSETPDDTGTSDIAEESKEEAMKENTEDDGVKSKDRETGDIPD